LAYFYPIQASKVEEILGMLHKNMTFLLLIAAQQFNVISSSFTCPNAATPNFRKKFNT